MADSDDAFDDRRQPNPTRGEMTPEEKEQREEEKKRFIKEWLERLAPLFDEYPNHWFYQMDPEEPILPLHLLNGYIDEVTLFNSDMNAYGFTSKDLPIGEEISRPHSKQKNPRLARWKNPRAVAECLREFVNSSMKRLQEVSDEEKEEWDGYDSDEYEKLRSKWLDAIKSQGWNSATPAELDDHAARAAGTVSWVDVKEKLDGAGRGREER